VARVCARDFRRAAGVLTAEEWRLVTEAFDARVAAVPAAVAAELRIRAAIRP